MIVLLGKRLSSSTNSDDFGNFLLRKLPANDFLLYQHEGRVLLLNGWDYTSLYPLSQESIPGDRFPVPVDDVQGQVDQKKDANGNVWKTRYKNYKN